ncbi:MAG: PVC-type heme-binding CxxCH protein, partial [Akkermansiaceae bacterium]
MKTTAVLTALSIVCATPAIAKKTHSGRTKAMTPEEERAGFTVPEGFVVELVASEKDGIVNPIDLTFDDAGRLWTQTARMYPLDPVKDIKWNDLLRLMDNPAAQDKNPEFKRIKDLYQGKTKGKDDILVISNIYSGKRPTVKKFATGLTIPQSILPYKSGAFVMQGSELFFLKDNNGDGKSDKRIPVLTGFGFTDTHTMGHCLVRGPGGWVHFSQGALNKGEIKAIRSGESTRIDYSKIARFSLDGNHIELVNAGLNNIWGFQLRGNGQWFMTEANDLTWSVVPAEPFTAYEGIGGQKLRAYQPFFPKLHKFRVGGTGISGLAFSDDTVGGFPREWADVAFLANPITSTINSVKIVRNADGTVTAKHLPDLLKSKDDWFRPVNIEFGPDGCLYVADWYNKIVSHNELPTTHPDRDKSHGRIWRIRHVSQKPRSIPNVTKAANEQLIAHLKSASLWEKRAAAFQIGDRQVKELIPALNQLVSNQAEETSVRIHALWALEGLHAYDAKIIEALITDKDGDIRREAIRSLITFKPSPTEVAQFLTPTLHDANAMVRSQTIRTLEQLGNADNATIDLLVSFCRPLIPGNALGGSYERSFERYLARRALEKYPAKLKSYLTSDDAGRQPATNLVWAMQALGKDAATSFAQLWNAVKDRELTLPMLIIISDMASNQVVYDAVLPKFKNPNNAQNIIDLALINPSESYSPALSKLLQHPVETLLKGKDAKARVFALMAIMDHFIPANADTIKRALGQGPAAKATLPKVIEALSTQPASHKEFFLSLVKQGRDADGFPALIALGKADPTLATQQAIAIAEQRPNKKNDLIKALGTTTHGTASLLQLLEKGLITPEQINYDIADRIRTVHPNNARANELFQQADTKRKNGITAAMKRLPDLVKLDGKPGGNHALGKALFQGMCLTCHSVAGEGRGIAPALDGSAKRDPEAIFTALLNPDAAVEGAYVLHRVITKAGDIIEGYRQKTDTKGTLIATLDNRSVFVPAAHIAKSEFVGSRS